MREQRRDNDKQARMTPDAHEKEGEGQGFRGKGPRRARAAAAEVNTNNQRPPTSYHSPVCDEGTMTAVDANSPPVRDEGGEERGRR